MTCGLIDIGANLLHEQFAHDLPEVLDRAHCAGVERIVITATTLEAIPAITAFIKTHRHRADWPRLYSTAGVHPHDAASTADDFEKVLAQWLEHPDVISAGEAGLDYHRGFSPRDVQRRVFTAQIALARETDKPLFVHDRESAGETLELLEKNAIKPERVVIHCFTGTEAELEAYLAAGFWIGITGWVCDKRRGEPLRRLVPSIPLDRLLIETDAPYLLPHDLPAETGRTRSRSRRNEPAHLGHIARTLAQLMAIDADELISTTRANALEFFCLADSTA